MRPRLYESESALLLSNGCVDWMFEKPAKWPKPWPSFTADTLNQSVQKFVKDLVEIL